MSKPPKVARLELDEAPKATASAAAVARDMSLVGHVPVSLSARLGQAELSVARLLSLCVGEVLTLNESLDEPIVLFLNDKPIARGELVAVDECFGVRITEVL